MIEEKVWSLFFDKEPQEDPRFKDIHLDLNEIYGIEQEVDDCQDSPG